MQTIRQTNNDFLTWLSGAASGLAAFLASIPAGARAARRASEVEHLLRLSDAELARRGKTRDGLVRWVFAN